MNAVILMLALIFADKPPMLVKVGAEFENQGQCLEAAGHVAGRLMEDTDAIRVDFRCINAGEAL